MDLSTFIASMPKAELHVHLEGAIRPGTLLRLARKNDVALPADTIEGLALWYRFTSFPHFIDAYSKISQCVRDLDDIELIAREFLEGQAAQHVLYSEVTYTAYTHYLQKGIAFAPQLAALNRARTYGIEELGVSVNFVIDIPRLISPEEGLEIARWAIDAMDRNVVALGLGGPEVGHPPEKFTEAFALAARHGLPAVPHAGETVGPESIWGALRTLHAVRIGHGVRCVEDPELILELRRRQIPLEVCPTSNVCLGVVDSFEDHPLPRLLEEGLFVTVNSDDPPLFGTTLTQEYQKSALAFGWGEHLIERLVLNAVKASLLSDADRSGLRSRFEDAFLALRSSR